MSGCESPKRILLYTGARWTTAAKQGQRKEQRHQPASNPRARRRVDKRELECTEGRTAPSTSMDACTRRKLATCETRVALAQPVPPDAGIFEYPLHSVSSHPGSGLLSVSNVTGDVMRLTLSFRISSSVKKPNPISSTAWRITVLSCDMPPNGLYCCCSCSASITNALSRARRIPLEGSVHSNE